MALDPNIALGVRPMELANPLAQYSQVAQIQNAQNQNQLAQFQLGAAQRAEKSQNLLADAYSQATDPATGKIDYNKFKNHALSLKPHRQRNRKRKLSCWTQS